jgi:Transposase DDE domain
MTVSQNPIPVQFEELDKTIQELLGKTANELAREAKFVQRQSAMDGAHFAQALIFGWMVDPDASYSFLQEMLEISGCDVTAQALEKRLTSKAADFLLLLLHAFVYACVASDPVMTELLSRFEGVYLQDGTVIALPNELEGMYRGCGGNTSESGRSALRVQVRLNLNTGALQGPWIASAADCERKGPGSLEQTPLPAKALRLTDSGYITLHEIKERKEQNQWWMSHSRADFHVTDASGVKRSLPEFLKKKGEKGTLIDETVFIGSQLSLRQKVRIIAFPASAQSEKKRKERVGKQTKARAKGVRGDITVGEKHVATKTKRHRHRPSKKRIALSGWTIIITNVPQDLLAAHEARVLLRSRWQIELLWRRWKERGHVDIWRSAKPMRILCEVYAKLMGCLIQHWVILQGCWQQPNRSMVKASQAVKALMAGYLLSWAGPLRSPQILAAMGRAMKRAQLNRRPMRLSTAQLLEQPSRSQALG